MNVIIEQYKILWESLNHEMNRFWNRYNVLLGIQIAIIVTVVKSLLETSNDNNEFIVFVYLFLCLLSFVTCAIVERAIAVYEFSYKQICAYEKRNKNNGVDLITEADLTSEARTIDISVPRAYQIALVIPVMLFVGWALAFMYEITILLKIK